MLFPIGDDNLRNGTYPLFSYLFIALNGLVFFYQATLDPAWFEQFLITFGSIPQEIAQGSDLETLITSMFLHGDRLHLLGNMLFLWVFGDNIEAHLGNGKFVLFYLMWGIVASLAHVVTNIGSDIPAVGASGAISAVLGAYLLMFPHSKIKVLYLYHMRTFYVPAMHFLWYWILFQVISGVGSLANSAGGGGVAWRAHIGGFVFGVLVGRRSKHNSSPRTQ